MLIDLTDLPWTLIGWVPNTPAWLRSGGQDPTAADTNYRKFQCTPEVPAHIPGSVQDDLLRAGLLPDWNVGLNAPLCEWVEHRHWEYRCQVTVPSAWEGSRILLCADGLDYSGQVMVDGRTVAHFSGMLMPHEFDLTKALKAGRTHCLSLIFDQAPHEQGQIGFTSQSHIFKSRFNYGWDWVVRLVPLGIWDRLALRKVGPARLHGCLPDARYDVATGKGSLSFRLDVEAPNTAAMACHVVVRDAPGASDAPLIDEILPCAFAPGRAETQVFLGDELAVQPWWPNGLGAQKLYEVTVDIETLSGQVLDSWQGRVGFKQVRWLHNDGSPANAEPWICEVNGMPVFLQGVNWVPPRITYGSVTHEQYAERLALYADMGCNVLRVWGGSVPEKKEFYDLCDELGLMVWQEFPLSSSGADNYPPEDPQVLANLTAIAASYVWRRGGHVSHLIWCGGNELTERDGRNTPVSTSHPAIAALGAVAARLDPGKRFVATSPSGPSFSMNPSLRGLGMHHDVHGPWDIQGTLQDWKDHWNYHDALFVSEVGAPGCSPVDILERYAGGLDLWPPSLDNPAWRYRAPWWVQWDHFAGPHGFAADRAELDRFVQVSQQEQAEALAYMAQACKRRFPRCGGVILWMGHDCYPCPSNTAIVDFWARPKPAALALRKVFRGEEDLP